MVLLIVGGTLLLTRDEAPQSLPVEIVESSAPPPTPPPFAAPLPIVAAPEPVALEQPPAPAEADAGLAELEIEIFEGSQRLIGVRVELEGPQR